MGVGVFVHYVGALLLLAATVFLLVADITAPVVDDMSMLNVVLQDRIEIYYGSFGYCVRDLATDDNACTSSRIGYDAAEPLQGYSSGLGSSGIDISDARANSIEALTNVMVLHPIATGLCFIAFLLTLGVSMVGSFLAALMSGLGFVVTIVAMICDFVGFSLLRQRVNDSDLDDTHAQFGVGMWCILAAAICSLLGTILVFVTCCAGRRKQRRQSTKAESWNHGPPPTTYPRRRYFWQRRR